LLEGEGGANDEDEDEDEKAARMVKCSRRQLGTNADRYKEEEPELGSDGECFYTLGELQRLSHPSRCLSL
jgi:hypothetical protein